jgi:hypothetical protein
MKITKEKKNIAEIRTWEEESGLLDFLKHMPEEIDRFNDTFGFGINNRVPAPLTIDGESEKAVKAGFLVTRDNPLLSQITYCLYGLLEGREFAGYIGIYKDGNITTIKELKPVKDFRKGQATVAEWLRQLVKASCEKIML